MIKAIKNFNKATWGWVLYDFANSAFTTIIVTVIYSVYFKNAVVNAGQQGTALWGRSISIAMLLTAFTAPIFGAIADYSHSRKKLLIIYTWVCVLFTALLYFVKPGDIALGMLFFIIANFAFNSANVFYNSFLIDVSNPKNIGKVSGFAWGVGYLGGLSALMLVLPFATSNTRLVFPITALFVFIFSLFTVFWLKETPSLARKENYLKIAFQRLGYSFKNLKKLPELLKFVFSYFIYNDGIVVVIAFSSIYGSERFGMTTTELVKFFMITQITSFIGAVFFGWLLDKTSARKTLLITMLVWIFVVLGAYYCQTVNQFYAVGLLAGLAIGSSQSASRTMLTKLTPPSRITEFFGFYSATGRLASIFGPLVYGEISRVSGSQKNAILAVIMFFITGSIILAFVDEQKGQVMAKTFEGENNEN